MKWSTSVQNIECQNLNIHEGEIVILKNWKVKKKKIVWEYCNNKEKQENKN